MKITTVWVWRIRTALIIGAILGASLDRNDVACYCAVLAIAAFIFFDTDKE